jgi:hypothetical protein
MALDNRPCKVNTAAELDNEIREIFALDDKFGRGDEISGTLHVYYTDESVKSAQNIRLLEEKYGVQIEWHEVSIPLK